MTHWPEGVRTLLETAGWTDGRSVDTRPVEAHLTEIGYSVFPAALAFIREFGGLCLAQDRSDARRYRLKVDPIECTQLHPRQTIVEFEQAFGGRLCPVALALNGTDPIIMDEPGSIYCVAESLFYRVAHTAPDAIRILRTTNLSEFEKILELD